MDYWLEYFYNFEENEMWHKNRGVKIKVAVWSFLIAMFCLTMNSAFSNNIVRKGQKNKELLLQKSYDSIVLANDSLEETSKELASQIKVYLNKFKEQEKKFENTNDVFVIITMILTALTILVPIVTIFLGYLPLRSQKRKLKRKVYRYIISQNKDLINSAIEDLMSDNVSKQYQAALFISNNNSFKFKETHLDKIVRSFSNIQDIQTQYLIIAFLATKSSLQIDRFFREVVEAGQLNDLLNVVRYLAVSNSNFEIEFEKRIRKEDNPMHYFSILVVYSSTVSLKLVIKLLDCSNIIDYLLDNVDVGTLEAQAQSFKNPFTVRAKEDWFENTYFFQAANEKISDAAISQQDNESESAKKEEIAENMIVEHGLYKKGGRVYGSNGKAFKKQKKAISLFTGGYSDIVDVVSCDGKYVRVDTIPEKKKK